MRERIVIVVFPTVMARAVLQDITALQVFLLEFLALQEDMECMIVCFTCLLYLSVTETDLIHWQLGAPISVQRELGE